MKKSALHMIVLVCFVMLVAIVPTYAQAGNSTLNNTNRSPLRLGHVLSQLGDRYNCYFTVEEVLDDEGSSNLISMQTSLEEASFAKENLYQDLEYIKRLIPNFDFSIDPNNGQLVHIMDNRLLIQNEYGLNKIIRQIDFNGPVDKLIESIGKKGFPISRPITISTTDILDLDIFTKVHVQGEQLTVRDALSNFIDLQGRRRILWIARTKLGQNQTSYIKFIAPAKKTEN